ncbi:hypothetical protein [Actinobaculum sp. 313]|uniref:hypothetical protein n=1 Tax=Actinobaculum sp. 313 TaxID=2495645 RepID=UPI000D525BE7|nr:hypothetical protein [Actinobaculum sp. 313]AWE42522.1 hypothetical protein DDD63_06895 [Actinobaculum sp. 313]
MSTAPAYIPFTSTDSRYTIVSVEVPGRLYSYQSPEYPGYTLILRVIRGKLRKTRRITSRLNSGCVAETGNG